MSWKIDCSVPVMFLVTKVVYFANYITHNKNKITLFDNASKNREFLENFDKVEGLEILYSKEKLSFGGCIQQALSRMKLPQQNILIMDPNVVAEDNKWLSNLGNCLFTLKDQGVKMVSPRTDCTEVPEFVQSTKNTVKPHFVLTEEMVLPLFCAFAKRELFSRIGGFDTAEELGKKMKEKGYHQAVCGNSWVKTTKLCSV